MNQLVNPNRFYKVNFIAVNTIIINEIQRFFRIWQQTLLPSAITITLYFIIFGTFIGKRVGTIDGFSYMQFIMPGLVMMAIIVNAYSNVSGSFYSVRFQRSVEELLIAPVPNWLIIIGYSAGGIVRGILNGILVMFIALFFTHLTLHHLGITMLIMLLTSILFSLAGFTNALFARNFDEIALIPTFVLTPLTYLGGVFYSLHQLPYHWQVISKFNPVLYMVNSFRYGILGISDVPVNIAIVILTVTTVAVFWLNIYLLRKGVGVRS